MTLTVFIAVLFAALLHAGWNVLIKTGTSKQKAMLLMSVCQGMIGVVIILLRDLPGPDVWVWIAASGVIHCAYQLFLAYAYEQGDLSRVYPIARGTAPFLVLVTTAALGIDVIAGTELWGVIILLLGILLMARGVFTSGESRRLLPFAFGSAVATAGYSMVDGLGARIYGDPLAYVAWSMVTSGALYPVLIWAVKGRDMFGWTAADLRGGMATGAISMAAYMIVVWAMTLAPIALVTALRETSILFAMVLGWLVFGDKMNATKIGAGLLILAGVVLTRA